MKRFDLDKKHTETAASSSAPSYSWEASPPTQIEIEFIQQYKIAFTKIHDFFVTKKLEATHKPKEHEGFVARLDDFKILLQTLQHSNVANTIEIYLNNAPNFRKNFGKNRYYHLRDGLLKLNTNQLALGLCGYVEYLQQTQAMQTVLKGRRLDKRMEVSLEIATDLLNEIFAKDEESEISELVDDKPLLPTNFSNVSPQDKQRRESLSDKEKVSPISHLLDAIVGTNVVEKTSTKECPRQEQIEKKSSAKDKSFMVIEDTSMLVQSLNQYTELTPDYQRLKMLAFNVIEIFAKTKVKAPALIKEVAVLAASNDEEITRQVLEKLINPIKKNVLLDKAMIRGLVEAIQYANPSHLDQDDLVNVMNIIFEQLSNLHIQPETENKLYEILIALSDLLDVMGDVNVIELDRINYHEPIYLVLHKFSKHPEPRIAAQAAYAQQALVRIPSDESKLEVRLRKLYSIAKGTTKIARSLLTLNPFQLFEAFKDLYPLN